MKTILAALAVFTLAAPAAAETRTFDVSSFDSIHAAGPYLVQYVPDDAFSVTAEGTEQGLRRLRVWVEDGTLRIKRNCTIFCGSRGNQAVIRVRSPGLEAISAAMGVAVHADGVQAQSFSIDVAMGASARISGACGALSADASMGGALNAEEFTCRRVDVDASMGGSANVHAVESVVADATMGGSISVAGSPGQRTSSGSMGGSISID